MKKSNMGLFLLCAVLLFSCEKTSEPPEAAVARVYQDDMDIARIAEDARNTLPVFFRYLTTSGAGANAGKDCYVKYPFLADEDSGVDKEQVWLTGIQFSNGKYFGVLVNAPRHLSGMKRGDRVIFDMDTITDWMYIRGGKITGGESIKYLLEKIPEDRRSDRERELLRMLF
jgi:uncharacterized protein YegJ (DUF2314 family)